MGRSLGALAAGLPIVLAVAVLFTPEGHRLLEPRWAVGALWLLPPLILTLLRQGEDRPHLSARFRGEGLPEIILTLLVLGCLFTGATAHPWFFFVQWVPLAKLNPLRSGPAGLFFLTAFFWSLLLLRRALSGERLLLLLLLGTQALSLAALLTETQGLPLYRDDHPSFMFRLWAFGSIFPRLTSYTPYWNGGVMEGVITKTGVIGPGILLWPFWKFAAIERVYTPAIGFVYIIFIPWLSVLSLRFMRLSWTAALAGGLLSVAVSLTYFLWFLHFGTIGANLSSAFVLPFGACLYRIVVFDDRKLRTTLLLALSAFFLLLWPPGAIMLLVVLSGLLLHCRRLTLAKMSLLVLAGAVTALLYIRQIIIILKGSELLGFVLQQDSGSAADVRPGLEVVTSGLWTLLAQALRANPLLIFLGVGGIFILRDKNLRLWCAPIIALFAVLAAWGETFLPNLQLGRMIIPLLFVAVIPAAVVSETVFQLKSRWFLPFRAALFALLLLTGLNGARVYGNAGPAPYVTMGQKVNDVVDIIKKEVPEGGRVLFAGKTVHAFGRGHVAYLPALAGREMMACDYYAFPPEVVEYNYPPRKYRGTREDTFRFMDLYNVVLVLTYHNDWRRFLLDQPERYEPLSLSSEKHGYSVFRVLREPSVFLKGEGSVEAQFNVIRVRPEPGEKKIILSYNWHDSLQVDGPAEIKPLRVWKDLRFITVRPNGAEEIVIRHRSWL